MNGSLKKAFLVDFRIDIRTKEMLNITPCQKGYIIEFVSLIINILASNSNYVELK